MLKLLANTDMFIKLKSNVYFYSQFAIGIGGMLALDNITMDNAKNPVEPFQEACAGSPHGLWMLTGIVRGECA